MPLIIPPGYADVAVQLRAQGDPDPWYVTWGVDCSGVDGDVPTIAGVSCGAFASVMTYMSNIVTLTGAAISVGQDGPQPIREFYPLTTPIQGGGTSQKLPQNCALLVRKNSSGAGRRSRGRMFLPLVIAEGEVSNVGLIDGGSMPIVQAMANSFWAYLNGPPDPPMSTPMVILHSSGGVSEAGVPNVVTSLAVDPVIATQRRRLR